MSDEGPKHLRLLDALVRWCDQELVECVRREERKFIAYELHQVSRPKLSPEHEWRQPTRDGWHVPTDFTFLTAAWRNLENDFARRIEGGELYLEGVLSTSDPCAQPESIPNAWAAELAFDLDRNTVRRGERRYLAVMVSQSPSAWAPVENSVTPCATSVRGDIALPVQLSPITESNVRELTDEEVLILLEDHARRVVESADAKLIAPGKISLIPIVRRKMLHRFQTGETRPTLEAEAHELEDWIAERVPSHHAPKASTIEKTLRKDYQPPKRRSKAEIG